MPPEHMEVGLCFYEANMEIYIFLFGNRTSHVFRINTVCYIIGSYDISSVLHEVVPI